MYMHTYVNTPMYNVCAQIYVYTWYLHIQFKYGTIVYILSSWSGTPIWILLLFLHNWLTWEALSAHTHTLFLFHSICSCLSFLLGVSPSLCLYIFSSVFYSLCHGVFVVILSILFFYAHALSNMHSECDSSSLCHPFAVVFWLLLIDVAFITS